MKTTRSLRLSAILAFAGLVAWACGSDEQPEAGQEPSRTWTVRATRQAPAPPTLNSTQQITPSPAAVAILVGAGDISSCTQENDDETAALLDGVISSARGEVVIFTTGDNAYQDGTVDEFRDCYHPTWGRHKDRTRPAAGNHDYHTDGADGYFSYFGAAAGDPGQGYYSYDLGGWHIVVLNTGAECEAIACGPGSRQEQWLRDDLASHAGLCTLAMWHHPLFSSGRVHGNYEPAQPFWDTLYEYGAELVLNGHEHNYERFAPQKPSGDADPEYGIRQIVVGTGGESHYFQGDLLPNSEVANGNTYGVLKLDLRPGSYEWEFIPAGSGRFTDAGSGQCHGPSAA